MIKGILINAENFLASFKHLMLNFFSLFKGCDEKLLFHKCN